ncbi:hypothetical protein PACTADRAFT_50701 [Pachysolen tannophilus NRRL Y-2460]|uniref:Amino acid permease/ SLC12A domain-containing protein n=1 Tax=Pachysolen tannophilus NRRL Y-2460 TaxID=669874 RepID=A0A1E4TSX1_PACTA|nr:hypothetical protein PACTADRAFT_50701 [Pachysolen tannophilus NRRL Y-2460]
MADSQSGGADGHVDENTCLISPQAQALLLDHLVEDDVNIDSDISPETIKENGSLVVPESSPHGRYLGLYSTIILFVARMVGSGIFATPGGIFVDCSGSPFLFFATWFIGFLIALSGLWVYLELGSFIPRSGATKVFLEFMFPNPKFFSSMVFGFFTVFFSLSTTNAIVFGEYIRYAFGCENDELKSKITGICLILSAVLLHGFSRKIGILVQNTIGGLKLVLLAIMILSSFYVLILPSSITHLDNQLKKEKFFQIPPSFSTSLYASSVLKAIFSFGGWTTAHTVQSEIINPTRTLKIAAPLSLSIVFVAYLAMNLCYMIVLPHKDILEGGQLVGPMLFTKLFGEKIGQKLLSIIISICAAGNVFVVVYSDSKMTQEVAREGFLPFSRSIASNYPFKTPFLALVFHGFISCAVMFIPNSEKQIFNYIVKMQIYPNQLFHAILCIGLLFKVRRKYDSIYKSQLRAPTIFVWFCLVSSASIVMGPFLSGVDSANSGYAIVGLSVLFLGVLYWLVYVRIIPKFYDFSYIRIFDSLPFDGLRVKKWVKVYNQKDIGEIVA